MLENVTRSRLIQVWFATVGLIVVAVVGLGAGITIGTGAVLLTLCLAPPLIMLMLWPGAQPPTAGEVIRGNERRD